MLVTASSVISLMMPLEYRETANKLGLEMPSISFSKQVLNVWYSMLSDMAGHMVSPSDAVKEKDF